MARPKMIKSAVVLVALLGLGACTSAGLDPNSPGFAGNVKPGTVEDFKVNVGNTIYFQTDQTSLTATARATLQRQAAWLKLYENISVTVSGHADERGTREYNLGLSARRAEVTRSYLASLGTPPARLRSISYGKERPAATCDAESCWSQNRRAMTTVN
ncbi:MAG: OmpA family protein [Alphaproteobacteria bacterium]